MKPSGKLIILTYHRVGAPMDFVSRGMGGAGVSVEDFARQMTFLSRHCKVLTLSEALESIERGERFTRPLVVVTFDDGYKDNYTHAWPILRQCQIPATIFLVVSHMGSAQLIWQHKLYCLADKMGVPWISDRSRESGAGEAPDFRGAMRWFKAQGDLPSRDALMDRLWVQAGCDAQQEKEYAGALYLSWDEIREMGKGGIEFGSHSRTHPMLSSLQADTLRNEVAGSREILSEQLNKPVECFAYPYGDSAAFGVKAVQAVSEAGYKAACVWQWGANDYPLSDIYRLKRKGMNYSHPLAMWLEISGVKDRLRKWTGVVVR